MLLVLAAFPALASDLTVPQSTLYPFRSMIEQQEEFNSGSTGNGTIGAMGWAFSGGTVTQIDSEANRIGLLRRDTSAVINTVATLSLMPIAASLDPALPHTLLFASRLNTNDANTTVRFGTARGFTVTPPSNGIYLEKLDGDTNWFCVTRAASVETRVDSTVAVSTSFASFAYTRNSSGVQFSINGVSVCSLMTTNIPTLFVTPGLHIVTSAAAAKTLDTDYFQLKIAGIVR